MNARSARLSSPRSIAGEPWPMSRRSREHDPRARDRARRPTRTPASQKYLDALVDRNAARASNPLDPFVIRYENGDCDKLGLRVRPEAAALPAHPSTPSSPRSRTSCRSAARCRPSGPSSSSGWRAWPTPASATVDEYFKPLPTMNSGSTATFTIEDRPLDGLDDADRAEACSALVHPLARPRPPSELKAVLARIFVASTSSRIPGRRPVRSGGGRLADDMERFW